MEVNKVYNMDSYDLLKILPCSVFDTIFIDPPYATGCTFKTRDGTVAYEDKYSVQELTNMLQPIIKEIYRVLKDTGTFWIMGDYRFIYELKSIIDGIFGVDNFRSDIIWNFGGAGKGAKANSNHFSKNHNIILMYSKTDNYVFNKQYRKKYLKDNEYQLDENNNVFYTAPKGDYTDESIKKLEKENRIHWTKNGIARIKYFLEQDKKGVYKIEEVGSVWDDIPDMMHTPLNERTGYPTQKPMMLLDRILRTSVPIVNGVYTGLVGDFFGGGGTTSKVAQTLGLDFITCDKSEIAFNYMCERLGIKF